MPNHRTQAPTSIPSRTTRPNLNYHVTQDRFPPSPTSEGRGMSIGPYKLLQKIGEGGMGIV